MLILSARSIAIGALFIAFSANAQEARWGSPDDATTKELLAVEKMWLENGCSPQAGLKEYFAKEFQGTAPNGSRFDREATIAPGSDRDCRLGEVKIQFFGDIAAVAYGGESVIRKKEDGSEERRCIAWTDTWLKREGKWQIIAAQDNVVECK